MIGRVWTGVQEHFPARRSEWQMGLICFTWGLIVASPVPVFTDQSAWRPLTWAFSEQTWGVLACLVGGLRLIALIINGTFPQTWYGRWSPHVRAGMAYLTCGLFSLLIAGLVGSGSLSTAYAVYPWLLWFDYLNGRSAARDAAKMDKARDDRTAIPA